MLILVLLFFSVDGSFLKYDVRTARYLWNNLPKALEPQAHFYRDLLQLQLQKRLPSVYISPHITLFQRATALQSFLEAQLPNKLIWKPIFDKIELDIHLSFAVNADTLMEYLHDATKGCLVFVDDDSDESESDEAPMDVVRPPPPPKSLPDIVGFYIAQLKIFHCETGDETLKSLVPGDLLTTRVLTVDHLNAAVAAIHVLIEQDMMIHQERTLPYLKLLFILVQLSRYISIAFFNSMSPISNICTWFDQYMGVLHDVSLIGDVTYYDLEPPLEVKYYVKSVSVPVFLKCVAYVVVPNPDSKCHSFFLDDTDFTFYFSISEASHRGTPDIINQYLDNLYTTRTI